MKKKKPIVKYKGQQIYFDLNDNRFKVDDKLTGETFGAMYIWDIYTRIDHPIYKEAEEVLGYHSSIIHIHEVISNKTNLRTNKRVFERLHGDKSLESGGKIVPKNETTDKIYDDYLRNDKEQNVAHYKRSALIDKMGSYKEND